MDSSLSLLDKALTEHPAAFWCRELKLSRNTLATAKLRGRLSPTVAGNLARLLGEPIEHWITVAALEAEPASYARDKLKGMIDWRKR